MLILRGSLRIKMVTLVFYAGGHMEAAIISEKGRRPTMEDTYFLDLNFASKGWIYAGIYDGHSGAFAALYAAERLHQVFQEELLSGLSPQQAFVKGYEQTSGELKNQTSGATAVDFLIRDTEVIAANAGDARAIIISGEGVYQLTVDHRLDSIEERQRIEKMGGHVEYPYTYRGSLGLMPTRTLGDEYFKPVGVLATPSINEYAISEKDLFLLAACDGLFDFMTNEEVAELARRFSRPQSLVQALKTEVLDNRQGTDNLTILAVSLLDPTRCP